VRQPSRMAQRAGGDDRGGRATRAVTAVGVASGDSVTAAFDGRLLDRPSGRAEQPAKEALLVQYAGVYAPEPALPLLTGETGLTAEPLSYKIVRPSTVTAALIGPDGAQHPFETGVAHPAGSYSFTAGAFDHEGTWRFDVSATDDLGRASTIERTFRVDATLQALVVPRSASGAVRVGFTLTRPAQVTLRIETAAGVLLRALPAATLQAGPGAVRWDGRLPGGTPAFAGTYVAHLVIASDVGTSERFVSFRYRR